MNTITVAGNLGKDAELRALADGTPVASFSVADSQGKDKPPIWWNCSIFGKRATSLAPYLIKGSQVTVSGSAAEREWADKEGHPRKSLDLRVNDVALQGGKREEGERTRQSSEPTGSKPAAKLAGFDDMDDDIPF